MSTNVIKSREMSSDIEKCHQMSTNVKKCQKMSTNVIKFQRMSEKSAALIPVVFNNCEKKQDSGGNDPVFEIVGQSGTFTRCCGSLIPIP